jgi:hypothetical protein
MSRVWASKAPAAMKALVVMLQAHPDLAGVKVKDMGDLSDSDAAAVITVGMLNPQDDQHADATMVSASMSGRDQRENFILHCGLAVISGDEDGGQAVRDSAFGMLGCVGDALGRDNGVRGTVMNADISGWTLRIDQTGAGYRAQMTFEVAMTAFTN